MNLKGCSVFLFFPYSSLSALCSDALLFSPSISQLLLLLSAKLHKLQGVSRVISYPVIQFRPKRAQMQIHMQIFCKQPGRLQRLLQKFILRDFY